MFVKPFNIEKPEHLFMTETVTTQLNDSITKDLRSLVRLALSGGPARYSYIIFLKAIFHCDAKYLVSGCQHVGILEPTQTLKFAFYPTRNPNASQWNIGCVGTQHKILALAMYMSCFLC